MVRFRIDLYNGCGQPRSTGSDQLRAWLKSQDGRRVVVVQVRDLGNGSYVGETQVPWTGATLIRTSLTFAREFLQLSVKLQRSFHSMRWSSETLENGNKKEVGEKIVQILFITVKSLANAHSPST